MTTRKIAALILLTKDKNKVLLQLRDNKPEISWPNYWVIPGGHIEDEDSKEAVLREFEEETEYKAIDPIYLKKENTTYKEVIYEVYYFYDFYDGLQKIECKEGQKMEFIGVKELEKIQITPDQLKLIKELLKTFP